MGMELLSLIVWIVIIGGLFALALWAMRFVPPPIQYPLKIVIVVIFVIAIVWIVGGLLLSLAPPFPGRG